MMFKNSLLFLAIVVYLLIGVSCSVSSKAVKDKQPVKPVKKVSEWHCATKRGVAGSFPNITIVSEKVLSKDNDFCLYIIKSHAIHANRKLASIKFDKIRSPYDLLNNIKQQGHPATIKDYVDYGGLLKTRVEIPVIHAPTGKLTSARTRIDFISKKNYNKYDKSKCLYEPIPKYNHRSLATGRVIYTKNKYYFIRCPHNNKSIGNTMRVYEKVVAHLKK